MTRRAYIDADELPYGPGNPDYEFDGARQRDLDEEGEKPMTRTAAGISPEELSLQDAFFEGQQAGARQLSPSLNPYQDTTPEHVEWERGRQGAATVAAARMVA